MDAELRPTVHRPSARPQASSPRLRLAFDAGRSSSSRRPGGMPTVRKPRSIARSAALPEARSAADWRDDGRSHRQPDHRRHQVPHRTEEYPLDFPAVGIADTVDHHAAEAARTALDGQIKRVAQDLHTLWGRLPRAIVLPRVKTRSDFYPHISQVEMVSSAAVPVKAAGGLCSGRLLLIWAGCRIGAGAPNYKGESITTILVVKKKCENVLLETVA